MNVESRVAALLGEYLNRRPNDGLVRLEAFLVNEEAPLLTTRDVARLTGWKPARVRFLCRIGKIPFIPGKPLRFRRESLLKALAAMERRS